MSKFKQLINKPTSFGWIFAGISLILLIIVYHVVQQSLVERLQATTESQLASIRNQLVSALDRYAYLPAVLAAGNEIQSFLAIANPTENQVQPLNHYLATINAQAGTADIYLIKPDGTTIASSNWQKPTSFIGKNFAFRPYFQQAVQGHNTHYFALGTTSRERGYYFAAPIITNATQIVGVVVVKIGVDKLESSLAHGDMPFLITDEDGIIFMASQTNWLYHSLKPLSAAQISDLRASRRYEDTELSVLTALNLQPLMVKQNSYFAGNTYLVLYADLLAVAGWHLYLFADYSNVNNTATLALFVTALIEALLGALVYVLRQHQQQRRGFEQKAREELEAKVEERTHELRQMQGELIQSAKMAALGQLSAGINHELNNPLTAIRSYAENAAQFITINKPDIARNNLLEIVVLTERMATITRQLKTFSRKSTGQIEICDVYRALDSALNIIQPKISQTSVIIEQCRAPEAHYVQADLIWLEQILVNLLSNAIEAVQDQAEKHIWLELSSLAAQVYIKVRDNGKGISEEHMPHVFEAFFTTKTVGKGLGLGLSISYRLAKDMQGDLTVHNAPQGGAIFTLILPQPKHESL